MTELTIAGDAAPLTVLHDGQISLGDIILGESDENGVSWIVEAVRGWSDTPASTGQAEQRTSAHGAWLSPAYYGPRIIEIEGSIVANTWDGAEYAADRLMAALPLDTLEPLEVATNLRTLRAMVRQNDDPLVEITRGHARFSISLIAPDPLRYSSETVTEVMTLPNTSGGFRLPLRAPFRIEATTTGGVLTATNEGNMATSPTITVYGPAPAFTLTHIESGRTLRYHEPIVEGRYVVFDAGTKTALLDGTAARYVTGSWFDYLPGVNQVQLFSPAAYVPDIPFFSLHRHAWK